MASPDLPFPDLERVYEALALAIDRAGTAHETQLLAKLVLLLTQKSGDADGVLACLTAAEAHLAVDQPAQTPE
jgi:hypothetical protein